MSNAQKILEMIEAVDPSDTDTLDEIDARVFGYIRGWVFDRMEINPNYNTGKKIYYFKGGKRHLQCIPQYTRSRDTLKTIRPEGWIMPFMEDDGLGSFCFGLHQDGGDMRISSQAKTEELAELDAIIQAMQYERD